MIQAAFFYTYQKGATESGCTRYQSCQPERRHSQNDDLRQPGHRAGAGRSEELLVDADAQGSLTLSLGWEPDELPITLYDLMIKAIQDRPVTHGE